MKKFQYVENLITIKRTTTTTTTMMLVASGDAFLGPKTELRPMKTVLASAHWKT